MLQAQALEQGRKKKTCRQPKSATAFPISLCSVKISTSITKRAQQRNFAQVLHDTLPLGAVGLPWLEQPEVNHPHSCWVKDTAASLSDIRLVGTSNCRHRQS